jgi:16S rRNA (guanine(966)-N(2))-methyltransferase RsmD
VAEAVSTGFGGIAEAEDLTVRVIAGKFRSRRLKGPGTLRLRPTSDRLRETLFNILGPAVEDSLFVDLYAGTGAIGIEAVSRGAREVILVESNAKAAKLIRDNLASLGIRARVELIEADALAGLKRIADRHMVADFIFLDPPYEKTEEHYRALEFLDASHLIAPHGIVIVEHRRGSELPDRLDRLECTRQVEQGDAVLSFYRLAAAA